ncbi:F-box/FBD/LRR-repeat protein At1g13570-like isoform X2 [Impatiens glandulifera]|uniref:F-box/FBD/LRR-repeat protein At1g13570-like isoform X2 n=1 Tax=Impatiens glandulifera TaxID=253017 RepID=UPI001FB0DCA6|nr:F-box/FBD/LRR-repeat protein At1g13570-like isoform X2 [Impatiens glandulifera]XP_047342302.1 F-box/FBD/LRR-repeat protein At1g13570-like isoform X2 [Impatiens glandulifera]XP_047342303.1 F-box/FBD/LRR-repeat protein At1g13570-like isoform X2 [Impatiens glandulifera]
MKQREPPKIPFSMEMEVDKISNLPGHIIDKILSYLSLRDAVRTSILSTKWRYKWITLPHLVFDNQCALLSSQDQIAIKNKLVNIVDHVLLLHTGPIQKFKLSHRDLQGVSDIDRWILYLSRGTAKEFILEIWKGHRYKLPASLFSCQKLFHLELFNCLLKPPPTFNGFVGLKSLDLQHITMEQDVFEHLISSCPLLERLTLMNFDGFSLLNIHAPNLQFFDIGGVFDDVDFENTYRLSIVSIGLYGNVGYDENIPFGSPGNLIKFFSHLPSIQRLEIQSYFLKYLAVGKIPGRLPNPCIELNFLSVRINFYDIEETSAALCLLRSSPNLQELEILARPEEQPIVYEALDLQGEDPYSCPFNQLYNIKIASISGVKCELDFIKFLLASSPMLEKMTVKPSSNDRGWELMKELLRFRRASVQAEVIYVDP